MLVTITPGLDTAMVLRAAGSDGARHGVLTALGIALGCLCWGSAAAFGLGAVLHAWPMAFAALRWAGAAYLLWLGARLLIASRMSASVTAEASGNAPRDSLSFRRGLFTNLLNPKVGLFYVSLLPQFVPIGAAGSGAFRLALVHVAMVLAWFSLVALLAGGIRLWLRKPPVLTALNRLTGGVFVLFGLQLCLSATLHA